MSTAVDSRWTRAVRRAFSTHADPSVEDVLVPVLDFAGDAPEFRFSRDERVMYLNNSTIAAGGAATFARATVQNPTASSRLLVVHAVFLQKAAAGPVFMSVSANLPGGSVITANPRDIRISSTGSAVQTPYLRENLTPAGIIDGEPLPVASAAWERFDIDDLVIAPGSSLLLCNNTANEALTYGLLVRDLPLAGGETS